MIGANVKIVMAIIAVFCALAVLLIDRTIAQGTGLIVATLAAGAGWLFRDLNDEARAVRNLCQAHAAVIESQFEEINDCLSDSELDRFLRLAPEIAAGREAESIGIRDQDPFATLPNIAGHLHLLSPATVRLLGKWRVRGKDLFRVYDQLGTMPFSNTSSDRLSAYFDWVRQYRDGYRDFGFSALISLQKDAPGMTANLQPFKDQGAKEVDG